MSVIMHHFWNISIHLPISWCDLE